MHSVISVDRYIEDGIIGASQVEWMTILRERFCSSMQEKHLDYYNPDYTTQKLKRRIANQCGTKIKFWTPNFKSELVYSANLHTGQAIESAFVAAASEERRTKEAAYVLHFSLYYIWSHDHTSISGSWGMSVATTDIFSAVWKSKTSRNPHQLHENPPGWRKESLRTKRENCFFYHSGYLLLCFKWSVEGGQASCPWYSCPTPHGKWELVSMLNHFGHCISHTRVHELETAVCHNILQSTSLLPVSVSADSNVVTHFCWDNFDLQELKKKQSQVQVQHT